MCTALCVCVWLSKVPLWNFLWLQIKLPFPYCISCVRYSGRIISILYRFSPSWLYPYCRSCGRWSFFEDQQERGDPTKCLLIRLAGVKGLFRFITRSEVGQMGLQYSAVYLVLRCCGIYYDEGNELRTL